MRQFWSGIFGRSTGIAVLAVATGLLMLAPVCRAQSDAPGNSVATVPQSAGQAGDAAANSAMMPARARIRVVRLSDVEGKVQVLRGDQTQFPQALMNMPLTQGAQIDTGADGRAEIEFEDGSVARITPNSSLKISDLSSTPQSALDTTVEQLSGLIYYELRSGPMTPFHVTFNGHTASPLVNSTFRINLENHPQDLAVLDGRVQVAGVSDSDSAEVHQGKTIQFANGKYTIADWTAPNGFDDWNQQRDQEAAQEAQNQTPARVQQGGGSVMDSGAGWSDLDNAGGWYPLPGYGMVWQPYGVGADFDPYGYGTWANFGGGYSFISGYSWGWLPFNCGAWSYIGSFGWGWSPGLYGCGGFGFGIGYGYGRYGYWRGHRWGNGRYPHTNIHSGPPGYRAPAPPAIAKGQTPERLVSVGNRPGTMAAGNHAGRPVMFNGGKIAPLHSMMAGVRVPTHNAALYNNYPTHAFHGDIRGTLMSHTGAGTGNRMGFSDRMGTHGAMPGAMERSTEMNRGQTVDMARGNSFSGNNRAGFGTHSAFGQHTSFGPHGSFGGTHSAFAGTSFHGGGNFRGGGMGRSGGFSGGGYHGGGGGGGFHGGGGGGMGHGGGGGGGHVGR